MVAGICNPSYLGGREWKDHAQGQPRQKASETQSQETSQAWWCIPVLRETQEMWLMWDNAQVEGPGSKHQCHKKKMQSY
jgi:hypothetical protein